MDTKICSSDNKSATLTNDMVMEDNRKGTLSKNPLKEMVGTMATQQWVQGKGECLQRKGYSPMWTLLWVGGRT